jgi:hypothetical protein
VIARVAVVVILVPVLACGSAPPSRATRSAASASVFVVPAALPNGRVEFTIAYAYTLGQASKIPILIRTTRGTITGPVAARVVATGMGERGVPSEVLVRTLSAESAVVAAGQARTTTLAWDGRDENGEIVPGDAYVLVVEFQIDVAGQVSKVNANATLQWNP